MPGSLKVGARNLRVPLLRVTATAALTDQDRRHRAPDIGHERLPPCTRNGWCMKDASVLNIHLDDVGCWSKSAPTITVWRCDAREASRDTVQRSNGHAVLRT